MAAYPRVYDSRHLQADCQELGSAPEPYTWQLSTGCLYLFIPLSATLRLFTNGADVAGPEAVSGECVAA